VLGQGSAMGKGEEVVEVVPSPKVSASFMSCRPDTMLRSMAVMAVLPQCSPLYTWNGNTTFATLPLSSLLSIFLAVCLSVSQSVYTPVPLRGNKRNFKRNLEVTPALHWDLPLSLSLSLSSLSLSLSLSLCLSVCL